MIRKNFTLASVAAVLLVSGTAFAADLQPAAGEAPFFEPHAVMGTASQLQRADVKAQAVAQAPLAGNVPAAQAGVVSDLSRAQVREVTREAMAHGYRPASGELS